VLVRRALRPASVTLMERTRLAALVWKGNRVVGARLATPQGVRQVRARIVIGADGRYSTVARAVGAADERRDPAQRGFYYRYVRGWRAPHGGPPDGKEAHYDGDELAYVFPSDGGATCLGISLNLRDYRWMREAPEERFRERWLARPNAGPVANYVRVPVGPGWALVGDAGLHKDPWTGTGMDTATTHGVLLADALVDWFSDATTETDALTTYHQRRNETGMETYLSTVSRSKDVWPSYLATLERARQEGTIGLPAPHDEAHFARATEPQFGPVAHSG
jgi:flavin-dependent dehydrogenase